MSFVQPLVVLILTLTFHSIYTAHVQEIINGGIAHSITLQDEMEDNLRETFSILFDNFTRESISYSNAFMYVCDEKCMTNDEYEYGISSAFLLALMSERTFTIYPNKNSPFYSFYEELSYPWKLDHGKLPNRTKSPFIPLSRYKRRFYSDLLLTEQTLSTMDFDLHFKEEIIYLNGNYDWILDIRRHPNTAKKIPWLYRTHASDFIRLLHIGLFRLKQPIRNAINDELIEKVGESGLVCLHGNRNQKQQMHIVLSRLLRKYSSNYKFYITGVDIMFGSSPMLTSNITAKMANIDLRKIFKTIMNYTQINDHTKLQNLVDIHILKVCDVLIVSESSSGILAAHLRRKEDYLYCLRNGDIFPCTRRMIAHSFRDGEHKPEAIDIKYFCKKNENCGVIFS